MVSVIYNVTLYSGLLHLQVNLEYLAGVVFNVDGLLYPDSLVGTDSHTTMINGLGILGWGECNSIYGTAEMQHYTHVSLSSMPLCVYFHPLCVSWLISCMYFMSYEC